MRAKQFGPSVLRADLADRLVRADVTTRAALPPIEWRKFCLNGNSPSAQFQNQLHEATNQAVIHNTRQLFWSAAPTGISGVIPASSGSSRARFRFAFRTSTYMHSLQALVSMQPPTSAFPTSASFARLKIFSDAAETTVVATTDFYFGVTPGGTGASVTGWNYNKTVSLNVSGLSPNTDYYACFYDETAGRIHTATVIELQSMTQHLDGYLPQNLTQDSEVLSLYRQKVATIQKQLWKYSGPPLLNWTVNDATVPVTSIVATPTNILDASSTTVSANTPGPTWDMRSKNRRSQTTIPCVMKVFASNTSATLNGGLYLKDSTGATVASIVNAWSTGTGAHWESASFNLPATLAKYDLQFAKPTVASGTMSLFAVSIWPYET